MHKKYENKKKELKKFSNKMKRRKKIDSRVRLGVSVLMALENTGLLEKCLEWG